jgi:sugar phosphate isomerase/epimerase
MKTDRKTFLKDTALLAVGSFAGTSLLASGVHEAPAKKKPMGLQTYSLAEELLDDLPNGLARIVKMGFTDLELYGYNDGKFGDYYNLKAKLIDASDYKKMADDAGINLISGHCNSRTRNPMFSREAFNDRVEYWKMAAGAHAKMGMKYLVQDWCLDAANADEEKFLCELYNKVGEVVKGEGMTWAYHNHNMEFTPLLTVAEKERAAPKTPLYQILLEGTDPSLVLFEMDVYWMVMGQQDPCEWMKKYPGRFRLLHIKDREVIGDSGMLNLQKIYTAGYEIGIEHFILEHEAPKDKSKSRFEIVEQSAKYFQSAPFVK